MLTIYTTKTIPPPDALSFADTNLDVLAETLRTVLTHKTTTKIWFGYLEGWMLTAHEETLLRPVIHELDCYLVCKYPQALSHAWKNETTVLYGDVSTHGSPHTHNDGRIIQDGGLPRHGHSGSDAPTDRQVHKNRQAGSSSTRDIETRRD